MSVIDYKQVYAYIKTAEPTAELDGIMAEMENELLSIATPRKLAKVNTVIKIDGNYHLEGTQITLKSEDINRYFIGVDMIAVQCVTIGSLVDKRIDYYAKASTIRMIVLDALANVYVEQIADELSAQLKAKYSDKHMTIRYSAGYGDLSLDLQPQILLHLDATKRAGVCINNNNLMTPLKTITGFQGFGSCEQPVSFDCKSCTLKECGSDKCPRRKK